MNEINKMPAIFIGHGSPENAFEKNEFSLEWKRIASLFPEPKAIVAISAHWTNHMTDDVDETSITVNEKLETIHDFYGFPKNFYDFTYPANGNPELAKQIMKKTKNVQIKENSEWGLDHGSWSALNQMYPEAKIPVVQLSIDEDLPRETLFKIGQELEELRNNGILILGSGNIVHNLREMNWNGRPHAWATEFDEFIKKSLTEKNNEAIINFEKNSSANLALPTVEHFLPLLYVLGAAGEDEPKFFCEKIFASSLSMRCVAYGI
jgi:4,5-DOPA dioxygenase extradiol